MPTHKARFSIAQLLLLTTGVAVFCVVLMSENEWLRATYVTISLGIVLNALIAAVFARGERQAFSLGFIVGCAFFALAAPYASGFTLPYLLSTELLKWINGFATVPPTEMHFWIVVGIFWAMLAATCSGWIAHRWYCSVQAIRRQLQAKETDVVGSATS